MKQIYDERWSDKARKIKYFFSDVDGTLTDGCVYYSDKGECLKGFSLIDGTGFYLLKQMGIGGGIITGENSEIVRRRTEKLGLNDCILGCHDKYSILSRILQEREVGFEALAYIGDDFNDLQLLKAAGISFCPANANEIILNHVDFICNRKGGDGAFREAVERLIKLRQQDIYDVFKNNM